MNPEAIEGHFKLVLIQWMVIIAAAWAFGRLGKKFGQPLAVGEIAAGIILGPSVFGVICNWLAHSLNAPNLAGLPAVIFPKSTQTSMQLLGKLGLIFLLFQVGMEFDYSHLRAKSKTVTSVSIFGMVMPFLCGLAIGPWLHKTFAPETPTLGFMLFLCVALSISALPIMGRILLEMKLERTAIGAMGISAAAIDDVIGWVLLGVATVLATSQFNWWHLLLQIICIAAFFMLLQKVIGPALRKYWRKHIHDAHEKGMPNSFLALLLVALFGSCLVTHYLGIFVIFGAFLFGTCLHQEPGIVKAWRDRFSGVVLVAKNSAVAGELGKVWEARAVRKEYLAVIHGHVAADQGTIDAPLGKDDQSPVAIKDCVRPDGQPARTEFVVERTMSPKSYGASPGITVSRSTTQIASPVSSSSITLLNLVSLWVTRSGRFAPSRTPVMD